MFRMIQRVPAILGIVMLAAIGTWPGMASADQAAPESTQATANPRAGVMPARARPKGYSLEDIARATAAFNESDRTGPPPDVPFQILFDDGSGQPTFTVHTGTYFYVPVVYSDDSAPLIGDFPADVENRSQLRNYWYSQDEIGTVATDIAIDGRAVALSQGYTVGIKLDQPLPNGANNYITAAAFINPLPPGTHTVDIHFKATGAALLPFFPGGVFEFATTYTVIVK